MAIYALIGLFLGVFGGAYSALAAFRTAYEKDIHERHQTSEAQTNSITSRHNTGTTPYNNALEYKRKIQRTVDMWHFCNWIPTIIFVVSTYGIAAWAIYDWDGISNSTPINAVVFQCFRGWLALSVLVNGVCIYFANRAINDCRTHSNALKAQAEVASAEQSREINAAQPKSDAENASKQKP